MLFWNGKIKLPRPSRLNNSKFIINNSKLPRFPLTTKKSLKSGRTIFMLAVRCSSLAANTPEPTFSVYFRVFSGWKWPSGFPPPREWQQRKKSVMIRLPSHSLGEGWRNLWFLSPRTVDCSYPHSTKSACTILLSAKKIKNYYAFLHKNLNQDKKL